MAMKRKKGKGDAFEAARLGTPDLVKAVRERRRELMDVRFESAKAGTAPAGRIRTLRREVAQALTELRRRRE